jgi:hypothetical protein
LTALPERTDPHGVKHTRKAASAEFKHCFAGDDLYTATFVPCRFHCNRAKTHAHLKTRWPTISRQCPRSFSLAARPDGYALITNR